MIELANQFNRFGERCKYILNSESDLTIFESNFFDFIYTAEVLQHLPLDLTRKYLQEFIRVLKIGGILVFQIPVQPLWQDEKELHLKALPKYHPQRILNKLQGMLIGHDAITRYYRLRLLGFSKKWLYDKFGFRPRIEINCLKETEINELARISGATLVSATERVHPDMLNKVFVVVKSLSNA
jgi:SAM-dependent methyltransferase